MKQARMNIEYIDVMIEIFNRLPLKSLLRVRCVCKWWNQIISDPVFVSNYSSCNPQYKVSGFYLQKYLFLKMYSGLRFVTCTDQVDAAPKPSLSFIDDENGVSQQKKNHASINKCDSLKHVTTKEDQLHLPSTNWHASTNNVTV